MTQKSNEQWLALESQNTETNRTAILVTMELMVKDPFFCILQVSNRLFTSLNEMTADSIHISFSWSQLLNMTSENGQLPVWISRLLIGLQ